MANFRDKPVAFARALRRQPTEVETKLWLALRSSQLGGSRFRRQHPVGRYIADFACVPLKLIVELDGSQHADSQHDKSRDAWLQANGWRILRFWNNQVNENLEGVLLAIADAMKSHQGPYQSPHPDPLPQAGEGGNGDSQAGEGGNGDSQAGEGILEMGVSL